jgi:hypothetical protein
MDPPFQFHFILRFSLLANRIPMEFARLILKLNSFSRMYQSPLPPHFSSQTVLLQSSFPTIQSSELSNISIQAHPSVSLSVSGGVNSTGIGACHALSILNETLLPLPLRPNQLFAHSPSHSALRELKPLYGEPLTATECHF